MMSIPGILPHERSPGQAQMPSGCSDPVPGPESDDAATDGSDSILGRVRSGPSGRRSQIARRSRQSPPRAPRPPNASGKPDSAGSTDRLCGPAALSSRASEDADAPARSSCSPRGRAGVGFERGGREVNASTRRLAQPKTRAEKRRARGRSRSKPPARPSPTPAADASGPATTMTERAGRDSPPPSNRVRPIDAPREMRSFKRPAFHSRPSGPPTSSPTEPRESTRAARACPNSWPSKATGCSRRSPIQAVTAPSNVQRRICGRATTLPPCPRSSTRSPSA